MTEIQSATIQDVYKRAPDERLAELDGRLRRALNHESFGTIAGSAGQS